MDTSQFLAEFGTIAAAPNGVQRLREMILQLAVMGKLVPQDPADEPASVLLQRIAAEKDRLIREGTIKRPKPLPAIRDDEKPFELPQGWEWVRLGDVTNYGYSDKVEASDVDKLTWILELEDVEKITSRLLAKVRFSEREFKSSKNRFSAGDVIYGKLRPYLDKVIVADEDGVCTTEMIPLRSHAVISSNFLRLMMKSPYFISYATESTHGMNLPRLGTDKAQLALIPITSETEQKRIVAKVDSLMALCDKLEMLQQQRQQLDPMTQTAVLDGVLTPNTGSNEAWQRLNQHMTTLFHTPESVKALRETILQLAVMGKLVPQDPNDEPAAVLLQHIAAEKDRLIQEGKIKRQKPLPAIRDDEKPFELPKGWEWVRLASVTELITSGSRDWAKYYSNSGAIFIRMGNLSRGHYEMRLSHIQYISPPNDGEGSRTKLEESDLLISITGDVGMLGLVPPNFGEAYINQHTCLVRFMSTCRNRYFPELLRSPLAMDQFNAPQRGIKNSFRLGDVGEMLIPLPPLAEQQRIVAKVDSLMALCDKLETRLQAARETARLFAVEAAGIACHQ